MTGATDPRAALREHFGFADFRGPQETIIRHVLDGRDALVVMATGDGKSLCYQLPGLMLRGVTLVVSPLIALMEDQVLALKRRGLPAECIHSMLDKKTRQSRLQKTLRGGVKLLYVTPERFRVGSFMDDIGKVDVALFDPSKHATRVNFDAHRALARVAVENQLAGHFVKAAKRDRDVHVLDAKSDRGVSRVDVVATRGLRQRVATAWGGLTWNGR